MSFITSVRRAFGLTPETSEFDDFHDEETTEQPTAPETMKAADATQAKISLPEDDSLPADILTAVVELFNTQQPDFVKNCLDTEAQKQYLLNAIDSGLRERIEAAISRAHDIGRQQFSDERRQLAEEIETLRRQKQELEQHREESRSQKLSAERQKRALNERVHDLETQVQTLEADKEQYMLENRSMLNKLRVAQVTGALPGGELPDLSEIDDLKNDLEAARNEIGELKLALEHANVNSRKRSQQLKEQEGNNEELKTKITTLEQQLAEAMKLEGEVGRLKNEIAERDTMIVELQESRNGAANRCEDLCREIDAANERETKMQAEIESLKATIAENLRSNAEIIDSLPISADPEATFTINRDRLIAKPDEPEEAPTAEETETVETPANIPTDGKHRKRRRGRPRGSKNKKRFSAIDELMDSSDWLVAPSPTAEPKAEPNKSDDFGYQEPQKKPTEETDDRQLSLF